MDSLQGTPMQNAKGENRRPAIHSRGEFRQTQESPQRAEWPIEQGDQRYKGDQHGRHIYGQLGAVDGSLGGGVQQVDTVFFQFNIDPTLG